MLAPIPWRLQLHVVTCPDTSVVGRTWVLAEDAELVLGRSGDADVCLADPKLSRRHLVVRNEAGILTVQDLASRNGTQNGKRRLSEEPEVIGTDAVLRLGSTLLIAGRALDVSGDVLDTTDRLHDWAARQLVLRSSRALVTTPDATSFVSALGRRAAGVCPLVVGAAPPPARQVLLEPSDLTLTQLEPHTDAIVVVESATDARLRWAGGALLELPSLRERRDELVRLTRLRVPSLQRTSAWLTWLGLRLHGTTDFEAARAAVAEVPNASARDVRRLTSEPEPLRSGRQMWRPQAQELETALRTFPTIAAVATHFGRTRRQVYRWLDELGVKRPRGSGLED